MKKVYAQKKKAKLENIIDVTDAEGELLKLHVIFVFQFHINIILLITIIIA